MNTQLRSVVIVGLSALVATPLIVLSDLFFPFIVGKNVYFRIIVEIITAAWVVLAITDTSYRPRRSVLLISLAAFVAIIGLADIVGLNPFKSFWSNFERMEGWVTLIHLLALFVVASSVFRVQKLWNWFFTMSTGVSVFLSLYGILQLAGALEIHQGGVRVDATLGNAIYLAVYMLFAFFIHALALHDRAHARKHVFYSVFIGLGLTLLFVFKTIISFSNASIPIPAAIIQMLAATIILLPLAVYFYAKRYAAKVITIVLAVAIAIQQLVMLYFTATRGATLGLVAGVGLAALLISIFEKRWTKMRKIAIGALTTLVILVLAFVALKDSDFVQKSPVLSRFASISLSETTVLSRATLWGMAIEGFKERPVLGWGQENFSYVFNEYYDPKLYNQEQWFDRTHNVVFDWLIAGGILGLGSYLFFFGALIWFIWRRRPSNTLTIEEKSLLTGLLVGYFLNNLTVFDNVMSYIMFIMIAAYVHVRTSPQAVATGGHKKNVYALPVTLVVFLIVLYFVNVRVIAANTALIKAMQSQGAVPERIELFKKAISYNTAGVSEAREQLLNLADQAASVDITQAEKDVILNYAIQEADAQIAKTPLDARYYVFAGTVLNRHGKFDQGIEYLKKAVELSPKKQSILFELGVAYLTKGDTVNALQVLKTSADAEPSNTEAQLVYGIAAVYAKDTKLAQSVFATVATSTVLNDDRVLQAYYFAKNYTEALKIVNTRIALDPDNPEKIQNYSWKALLMIDMKNRTGAIAAIQKAIEINPAFKEQGDALIKDIRAGKNPFQ